MAAEMAGAGGLLSAPPPPTFRAPTRDSVLVNRRRSSTIDEQDLSFMDSEIKRLHRDMANMLAGEIPLGDDSHSSSMPPPAPSTPLADQVGAVRGTSGAGVVISRRTSPNGDSDFDYSDDDDGIAILKDDLRTTTERFFDRLPRQSMEEEQADAGAKRRASARVLTGYSGSLHKGGSGGRNGGDFRREYSWKSLEQLEKGVGGMMRRHTGTASTALQSLDGSGSCSSSGGLGCGADGHSCAPPVRSGSDPFVGGVLERSTAAWRRLETPATGARSPGNFPDNSPNSPPSSGAEAPQRGLARSPDSSVIDLKARSEEAARTLEALKTLLAKEGLHGAEDGGDLSPRRRERRGRDKLWPASGGQRTAEAVSSSARVRGGQNGGGGGAGGRSGGGESSKRMELLAQALDTLEQINAQLDSEAPEPSRRATGGRDYHHHHNHHRRARSSLGTSGRRQPSGRQSFDLPPGASSSASPRELSRQPRSSSDLLRHRRSEEGQAEPMSCGVPRHRVQVSKGGENNVVYFELAITQARSTWTVERRMLEFVELRKSLVATATDLAAAAATAGRMKQGSAAKLFHSAPYSPHSAPYSPAGGGGDDRVKAGGSGGGGGGGGGMRLGDPMREHRRQAETRVPPLPEERKSWFDSAGIWSVMYARKREENLIERQVQLASWLANVLADRELVSPELVSFLGGDSGGVQAFPVVEDVVSAGGGGGGSDDDGDSVLDAERACSWSGSSDEEEEEEEEEVGEDDDFDDDDDDDDDDDIEDNDDDDDDDLRSDELDSLRGSLCAPDEWDLTKSGSKGSVDFGGTGSPRRGGGSSSGRSRSFSPRRRLEKAMGKRLAARARREVVGEGGVAGWGAHEGEKAPDIPSSTGTSGELLSGGDTAIEDEDEDEEEDEEEAESGGGEEEEVQSPGFKNAFPVSMDASRQAGAPSLPSSSPTRRVMLDAFFQPPT